MRIREHFEDNHVHFKKEFTGGFALEMMLCDNLELYYGRNIRNNFEKMINTSFTDEEKEKQMSDLMNRINSIQKRF
jgi:hypothetical protein